MQGVLNLPVFMHRIPQNHTIKSICPVRRQYKCITCRRTVCNSLFAPDILYKPLADRTCRLHPFISSFLARGGPDVPSSSSLISNRKKAPPFLLRHILLLWNSPLPTRTVWDYPVKPILRGICVL